MMDASKRLLNVCKRLPKYTAKYPPKTAIFAVDAVITSKVTKIHELYGDIRYPTFKKVYKNEVFVFRCLESCHVTFSSKCSYKDTGHSAVTCDLIFIEPKEEQLKCHSR
jgi:hypothetical protein